MNRYDKSDQFMPHMRLLGDANSCYTSYPNSPFESLGNLRQCRSCGGEAVHYVVNFRGIRLVRLTVFRSPVAQIRFRECLILAQAIYTRNQLRHIHAPCESHVGSVILNG